MTKVRTIALRKEEKMMQECIPIFSEAFRDAAELIMLSLEGEERKRWENSEFYFMCLNSERLIFKDSRELLYNVKWANKPKESEAAWYRISVVLNDGRKAMLLWKSGRVTLQLTGTNGKVIEKLTSA